MGNFYIQYCIVKKTKRIFSFQRKASLDNIDSKHIFLWTLKLQLFVLNGDARVCSIGCRKKFISKEMAKAVVNNTKK